MLKLIQINSSSTACVIWLHGLGADGHDFEPVVQTLNLPYIQFVLPHAPYRKITMNNGYEMRAWYDLYGLTLDSKQDEAGIRESQAEIEAIIQQKIKEGIPAERIAIAGFSQGGAIALFTATRYKQKLAGALALSTYLPLSATLAKEKQTANQETPIFMAHGDFDNVISIQTSERSRDQLTAQHFHVEWHAYPMAHSVNPQEIADIRAFLTRILPK
ncbi:MAG: dienelactone hydrolase family protein [Methylophilus sp.]|nr:dienelactone hydrolase family protein [Methylophilus sp.]